MKRNLITLAGLSLLIGSCGGGGGANQASGDGSSLFASGAAPFALSGFVTDFLQTNHIGMAPSDAGMAPKLAGDPLEDCKTYTTGSSNTDKHYKIEYNCVEVELTDEIISWIGTYEMKQESDDIQDGYRYDIDLSYRRVYTPQYSLITDDFVGFNQLVKTATSFIFESEFAFATTMEPHDPPVDWKNFRKMKTVYIPDDMANPLDSGSMETESFFRLEGKIGGGPGGVDYGITKVGFEIVSEGLRYDKNCSQFFEKGSIHLKDGSGNVVSLVYDCDTMEGSFNGAIIDW